MIFTVSKNAVYLDINFKNFCPHYHDYNFTVQTLWGMSLNNSLTDDHHYSMHKNTSLSLIQMHLIACNEAIITSLCVDRPSLTRDDATN